MSARPIARAGRRFSEPTDPVGVVWADPAGCAAVRAALVVHLQRLTTGLPPMLQRTVWYRMALASAGALHAAVDAQCGGRNG